MNSTTETNVSPAFLSPKAVAAKIGLSKVGLRNLALRGEFPPFVRLGQKRVGYPAAAVEAWIADKIAAATVGVSV